MNGETTVHLLILRRSGKTSEMKVSTAVYKQLVHHLATESEKRLIIYDAKGKILFDETTDQIEPCLLLL